MNELEKQLKDWQQLKKVLRLTRKAETSAERKVHLGQFYEGVKLYWESYKTKFDFNNPPT